MTIDKLRHDLQRLGSRLALQALTLATMASSTLAGYLLHGLVEQTRLERWFGESVLTTAFAVKVFFRMDPRIAMTLVPVLIVSGLALSAMYVWSRRTR